MAWLLARSNCPEMAPATAPGLWDEVSLSNAGPPAVIKIDMIAITTSISTRVNPRCPSPATDEFGRLDLDLNEFMTSEF
jgi:hypothetical protein